ncbi:hypothetical protein KCU61_g7705, partial [Aureobasidium melanogenum]
MDKQEPSSVIIDLSQLPFSDGNGQVPDPRTHTQLKDTEMLKLLEEDFNNDNALVQEWGTQVMFAGGLPRGYSYWQHMTTSTKVPPVPSKAVKETFCHPRIARLRSCPELFRHVLEIMNANELAIRSVILCVQPTNPTNVARLAAATNRAVVRTRVHGKMAQQGPRNIDLSTLWTDGTGQTPTGAGWTQILRGTDRYNEYLGSVTRGCNRNAQMVARYGRVELTRGLTQGYTLWVQTTGSKPVESLYGHPRGNFRSALNFSDRIPEMLAADTARERGIRAQVKETNDEKARDDIRQNNKDASLYNAVFGDEFKKYDEEKDLYVSPYTFFTDRQANAAVLADRQANPRIDIPCSCVFR